MTTTPDIPVPNNVVAADSELAERCEDAGQYLAGILAAGMLDTVGRPTRLPEQMWPHVDPAVVRTIWEAGLAVGFRAGGLAGRPRWAPEDLDRVQTALDAAGYRGMARLASRSASLHPPRHPADTDGRPDAARGSRP